MKGIVLGFDPINGGLISAEDGKRYTLQLDAWRGLQPPRVGEQVDFEINGDAASEVYPLVNETESTQDDIGKTLTAAGKSLADATSRAAAEASVRLSEPPSNPTAQKLLENGKKVSASLFAVILICFFLPFVTVSCDNRPVFQMSGVEMATGKTVSTPDIFGSQTQSQKIPGDSRAALVFAAAALGIGTSLIKIRKSSLISAGIGAFGLVMLLSLKSEIDKQIINNGASYAGFKADYGVGFWGSILLFISAACLNIWLFFQKRTDRETTP
ncbi:MAG: hypothetical protein KME21_23705 [Desmonostoc vinosum HA7617-LM4]|jgi:hypothetical protein|nr:hypothetical protein [Desmonostoc vinosum HA7617-LM4]